MAQLTKRERQIRTAVNVAIGGGIARWKAKLAKVAANTDDATLLALGDSLTESQLMGTVIPGPLATSYPKKLADLFATALGADKAVIAGYCGTGNVTSIAALITMDPRLSFDTAADWAVNQNATLSSGLLSTTVNGSKMHFDPGYSFDSIQILGAGAGNGVAAIYLDGSATVVGTITGVNPNQINQTISVPRGVHVIDIAKTGGSTFYLGQILLKDSVTKRVRVINGGYPSVTAAGYVAQGSLWKMLNCVTAIAADLMLLDLGKNEQATFTSTPSTQTDYTVAMQTIMTAQNASGDTVVMYPEPSSDPLNANEVINRTLVDSLVAANSLVTPLDMVAALGGSKTASIAAGYQQAGDVHLSVTGYAQKAAAAYAKIVA
jgi:lysophospholipase L1-like esterase